MINKIKGLAANFFNRIYGASNKKLIVWSAGLLLMPFVAGFAVVWIGDHIELQPMDTLAMNAIGWLNNTGVFSFDVMVLISKVVYGFAFSFEWAIGKIITLILSPFLLGDALVPVCSFLSAILGALVFIKTKWQSLSALFVTSMSLVLIYAFIFVG